MAEEFIEEDDKAKKKTDSRKFVVWVSWGFLTISLIIISVISMIVMKKLPDTVIDLIKLVLQYFFFISLTYLGVNFGQKLGFAISDAIKGEGK